MNGLTISSQRHYKLNGVFLLLIAVVLLLLLFVLENAHANNTNNKSENHDTELSSYYGLWVQKERWGSPFAISTRQVEDKISPITVYISQCPGDRADEIIRRYYIFNDAERERQSKPVLEKLIQGFSCDREEELLLWHSAEYRAELSMFFWSPFEGPFVSTADEFALPVNAPIGRGNRFHIWPQATYTRKPKSDVIESSHLDTQDNTDTIPDKWKLQGITSAAIMLEDLGVAHNEQIWTMTDNGMLEVRFIQRWGAAAQPYAYGPLLLTQLATYKPHP